MRLELERSFRKKSKKLIEADPALKEVYEQLLAKLAHNPFDPNLHTHPLTGRLKGRFACSLPFKLRIIFSLYDDIVHLLDIGSHDEVY